MKILGIDFETQGKDPLTHNAIEVGAVLLDTRTKAHQSYNSLIWEPDYPPQTAENIDITGITDEQLKKEGRRGRAVMEEVLDLAKGAEYYLAHNKVFDEKVFRRLCNMHGLAMPTTDWVCTRMDIPYPEKFRCKQLAHLALDHGIRMDDRVLHRALDDVYLMLDLLDFYDFEKVVLPYFLEAWTFIQAVIPAPWEDNGKGKEAAQALGYSWQTAKGTEGPSFTKQWVKRVKVSQVDAEKKQASFPVREIVFGSGQ